MNSKRAALSEFYEVMLDRFGNDSETKSLIKQQIALLKNKEKISVADLETAESGIKSYQSSKYSPLSTKSFYSSKPQSIRKTPDLRLVSKKLTETELPKQYKSTSCYPNQKKSPRFPDNRIFPTESPIDVQKSAEFWRIYSCLSPKRNPNEMDVWAQIQKADYIKYKNEMKAKTRLKKQQQNDYKIFLDQQVRQSRKFKDPESLENSLILPSSLKPSNKNSSFRQDLDNLVSSKLVENQKIYKRQLDEDNKFLEKCKEEEKFQLEKIVEKKNKHKELSLEILKDSMVRKRMEMKKITEERVKSRELMNERIVIINNTEQQQRDEMMNRVKWVHDERRLKKLLPVCQIQLSEGPGNTGLPIGEIDTKRKQKILENNKVLEQQIKEKIEKESEDVREKAKDGERVRISGLHAMKEYEESLIQKKNKESMIRSELEKQISKKRQDQLNNLLFTDHEAKINKRIFESSLQILSKYSNSP